MKLRTLRSSIAGILLTALCISNFGVALAATTEHYVEFNSSKKMVSDFSSNDIADSFNNMEPGDDATFRVKVKNTYSSDTDWYMTNKVLQSLEEASKTASGGGYSYILTYTNPDGEKSTIYSSENVGGESYVPKREGLREATQTLEEYFLLDRLKKGEVGYVDLRVVLDGESQGNDYQDTIAKLQMNFAVELPQSSEDKIWTSENKTIEKVKEFFKAGFVKTSDNTNIVLLYIIAAIIGVLLLIVAIICIRIRKKMKGADEEWED